MVGMEDSFLEILRMFGNKYITNSYENLKSLKKREVILETIIIIGHKIMKTIDLLPKIKIIKAFKEVFKKVSIKVFRKKLGE